MFRWLSYIRDEHQNIKHVEDLLAIFLISPKYVAFQGKDKNVPRELAIDFFIKGLASNNRMSISHEEDDFDSVVANAEKDSRILAKECKEDCKVIDSLSSLTVSDEVYTLENK